MLGHKGGKPPKIPSCGPLRFTEDDVAAAHGDLRQHFSGSVVGNGKNGACIPVMLTASGIMLDHPTGPHSGQWESLREIMDDGGMWQTRCRSCRRSVIDGVVDLV